MKNKYYFKFILMVLSLFLIPYPLFSAVSIHPNAGTTSATFLKFGLGSRAVAMGEAFGAVCDDVTSLYWNPSGLVNLKKEELHLTHNESYENIRHDFIGYGRSYDGKKAFAAAIYGIYIPSEIERRSGLNENDPFEPYSNNEGYFGANDVALHFSYASRLNNRLSLGSSLKFIRQSIDDSSAYGAAVDFGSLYTFENMPLSLALVTQHIGTEIKFKEKGYYPPFNVKLAGAYRWNDKFMTTLDLNKPIDNFLFANAGCEFIPTSFLSLRAGYRYRENGQELEDLFGLAAGVGITFDISQYTFRFDYAISPYGVLGNSHRFSITSFFGNNHVENKTVSTIKNVEINEPIIIKPLAPKAVVKPVPVTSTTNNNYVIFQSSVTTKLKTASNRSASSSITISTPGCELYLISGIIKARTSKEFSTRVTEKRGTGNTYKEFSFQNSFPFPVIKAKCFLRLPISIKKPSIIMAGETIKHKIVSKDSQYIKIQFELDSLRPFTVKEGK